MSQIIRKPAGPIHFLLFYGFSHLIVDAACAFLVMGMVDSRQFFATSILLYNSLAFILQWPIGYFIDRYTSGRWVAISGLVSIFLSFLVLPYAFFSVILAGIGNAMFHAGGGQLSLNMRPGKAFIPAFYVAPGGIGLALGLFMARYPSMSMALYLEILLLAMIIALSFIRIEQHSEYKLFPAFKLNWKPVLVFLLLFAVAGRSWVGSAISSPWQAGTMPWLILLLAVASGKIIGGLLADKLGWMKTGVIGLSLSLLIPLFGTTHALAFISGLFFLNFSMAVTLIAVASIMPARYGTAFGLTTTALYFGALPSLLGYSSSHDIRLFSSLVIMTATISLFLGLFFISRMAKTNQ